MKFIKLLKYVESSYEGKPSFVILMSDNREYISNGCVFVENCEASIKRLIRKYNCEAELNELFSSQEVGIGKITNSSLMFDGCTSLVEFSGDLSSVTNSRCMFRGCTSLVEFSSDLSSVTYSSFMFRGCTSLVEEIKEKYLRRNT